MQQNLLLRCWNINKVVCFLVLNENENFLGKYSENSDLTRLVGRHSFGAWKTDALHKQTFQKVNKNWTSFHTRCLRTTGRWVATAIFARKISWECNAVSAAYPRENLMVVYKSRNFHTSNFHSRNFLTWNFHSRNFQTWNFHSSNFQTCNLFGHPIF